MKALSILRTGVLGGALFAPLVGLGQNTAQPVQLPEVNVAGAPVPGENKIVGSYGQPEWSARRPFPGVSVYVVPDQEYEFEAGFDTQSFGAGIADRREWTQELEVGLGHRTQLAVENSVRDFSEDSVAPVGWHENSVLVSARFAFADWGKMPLNPALAVGWRFISSEPDAFHLGIVIGDELDPRWHWAANVFGEEQVSGPDRREVTADGALTYSLLNETLNVGVQGGWRSLHGEGAFTTSYFRVGPCIQWRPWDEAHINAMCLWSDGSKGSPKSEVVISVGFEFGEGADDHDKPAGGGKFDR